MVSNWNELLEGLTAKINSEGKSVSEAVDDPYHLISDIFEPGIVLTSESGRREFDGRKGLYIFFMTDDVHLTRQQVSTWNTKPREAGLSSTLAQDLNKGDCLYVGSAYSKTGSLSVRLGKHFGPSNGSEPHGLALNYPTRNAVSGKVRVVIFPLKREFNKYAPLILPRIEKVLHNLLSPKAGSSRT